MKTRKKKFEELEDYIPKTLRVLASIKESPISSSTIMVYMAIVDRYNVSGERAKECYDSIGNIGKRAGKSKNVVNKSILELIKAGYLKREYRVEVRDENGSHWVKFGTYSEAREAINKYKVDGVGCNFNPSVVFLPPVRLPTLDQLGLKLINKRDGIYSLDSIPKPEQSKDKKCEHNYNEINVTEINGYENKSLESNELNINNKQHHHQAVLPEAVKESFKTFPLSRAKNALPVEFDPCFALAVFTVKNLVDNNFYGSYVRRLYKNKFHLIESLKPSIAHFSYFKYRIKQSPEKVEWLDKAIESFQGEVNGLCDEGIRMGEELLSSFKGG